MQRNRVTACIVSSTLASICLSACATMDTHRTLPGTQMRVAQESTATGVILFPLWSLLPGRTTTWAQTSVSPPWKTVADARAQTHTRPTTSSAHGVSSRSILFPLWSLAPGNSVPWTQIPSRVKAKPRTIRVKAKSRTVVRRVRASQRKRQSGVASWYGPRFHGRLTANGEIYDQYQLTAAHRTLPLGTWVAVKNPTNGKMVEVRINDRGPYIDGRIIDLSYGAAQALGMVRPGIGRVEVEVLSQ